MAEMEKGLRTGAKYIRVQAAYIEPETDHDVRSLIIQGVKQGSASKLKGLCKFFRLSQNCVSADAIL